MRRHAKNPDKYPDNEKHQHKAMSDAAQKRARDSPAVDLTDDPSPEKRQKKALTTIAKGKCKHKHLNPLGKSEAAAWLRELQEE